MAPPPAGLTSTPDEGSWSCPHLHWDRDAMPRLRMSLELFSAEYKNDVLIASRTMVDSFYGGGL